MKIFLVVMLLGNPTYTTWTEMSTMKACEERKMMLYKDAVAKNRSVLLSCETRKK